ncbi:MAG: hypothetical protein AB7U20_06625 [Planctomycetaceae bacterium]
MWLTREHRLRQPFRAMSWAIVGMLMLAALHALDFAIGERDGKLLFTAGINLYMAILWAKITSTAV